MASVSLPFFANAASLPAKLSSIEEIQSSNDVFLDHGSRKVVGVGPHFIIKFGRQVDIAEGEILLFLQRSTSIRAPQLYALFHSESDGKQTFIIMERIPGNTLQAKWSSMDQQAKTTVADKLRALFEEMKRIPSPKGYCNPMKDPLLDSLFWTDSRSQSLAGPFDTEAEVTDALIKKASYNNLPAEKVAWYRRHLHKILRGHPPRFTHGDFQKKNVIVRRTSKLNDQNAAFSDYQIVMIDWEFAGWYPSYWEYSQALHSCGTWSDDWPSWLDKILDAHTTESVWMGMLISQLWS